MQINLFTYYRKKTIQLFILNTLLPFFLFNTFFSQASYDFFGAYTDPVKKQAPQTTRSCSLMYLQPSTTLQNSSTPKR